MDRRQFLKIGASLSTLSIIPSLDIGKTLEASKVSLGLVNDYCCTLGDFKTHYKKWQDSKK